MSSPETREALLGLWTIPGLGAKALAVLERQAGPLAGLLQEPLEAWARLLPRALRRKVLAEEGPTLEALAARTRRRAEAGGMKVCFPGEAAFPEGLVDIPDAPPLLFYLGEASAPRRWVAMVGSRHPDPGFLPFARRFAREVAAGGVGIVSGGAEGVDRAAHWGALDAQGATWAFLGSALDEMDDGQRHLVPHLLEGGGVVYSELPPGKRASRQSFPRRNRLISGAARAVLVLRAHAKSGSLHTVRAAETQGRPVLALPSECTNPAAEGCNRLIRSGRARLCLGVEDVWEAVGRVAEREGSGVGARGVPAQQILASLSARAQAAYALLAQVPRAFEDILAESGMASAALTIALGELELEGLVVQHPGKLYEKL